MVSPPDDRTGPWDAEHVCWPAADACVNLFLPLPLSGRQGGVRQRAKRPLRCGGRANKKGGDLPIPTRQCAKVSATFAPLRTMSTANKRQPVRTAACFLPGRDG